MIKYPKELKARAIRLRKKGLSYNEIRREVPVAKSTLSLWLKEVLLKPEHQKRLYEKKVMVLLRGPKSQRERRQKEIQEIIQQAKKEVSCPLSLETLRLFGAAIYWAEGSKTINFAITNSDPYLITFMVGWFKLMFNVEPQQLKANLNIYPQQDEMALKKFWSNLTGVPITNFGKSFIKPPNKGYKKNNLYYGTIKIYVPKGTDSRHRTFGWVQAALHEIIPNVESTQRRWIKLTEVSRAVNIRP